VPDDRNDEVQSWNAVQHERREEEVVLWKVPHPRVEHERLLESGIALHGVAAADYERRKRK
jgi:predicted metalloenzyme YecM